MRIIARMEGDTGTLLILLGLCIFEAIGIGSWAGSWKVGALSFVCVSIFTLAGIAVLSRIFQRKERRLKEENTVLRARVKDYHDFVARMHD